MNGPLLGSGLLSGRRRGENSWVAWCGVLCRKGRVGSVGEGCCWGFHLAYEGSFCCLSFRNHPSHPIFHVMSRRDLFCQHELITFERMGPRCRVSTMALYTLWPHSWRHTYWHSRSCESAVNAPRRQKKEALLQAQGQFLPQEYVLLAMIYQTREHAV